MSYNLSAFAGAGAQFFDDNGDPLTGGLLYVYTAGTTTPATTWTSSSGASANTNPIVLDAAGRTPAEIWLNSGVTYKFILKTSTGVLVGTYNDIPAIDDPTVFNNLITVTGTNTLVGTSVPPYTAYVSGMTISFVPVATNTGAVTLDIDGLGAKNIYYDSSTPLTANAIIAGKIVFLEYDGTRFQMVNSVLTSQIPDGSITTAKLANSAVTTAKIADANVTTVKILDANVTTAKIADSNVTTAKIADANVTPAKLSQPMTQGTTQSASGTSVDFTGIPSWVKRITVMFDGVSTNGSSIIQIQLGSGSPTTSGYSGGAWSANTTNTVSTTGFPISGVNGAARTYSGVMSINSMGSNKWAEMTVMFDTSNNSNQGASSVTLSGTLDRVRITTVNGTDTFDAGSINILYEG